MLITNLMIIIHLGVCLALILIILLQTGKGAGMGAAFGGASQTLFGSTGRASFLTKVTIGAAVVFMITSLGLSFMKSGGSSVMNNYQPAQPAAPQQPAFPQLPTGLEPGAQPAAPTAPGAQPATPTAAPTESLPALPGEPEAPAPSAPAPAAPAGNEGTSPAAPAPAAPAPAEPPVSAPPGP